MRECVRDVLEDAGYHVSTAVNREDALARLGSIDPCILVLDLMMPVMTGAQFISALRGDERIGPTPVVVVSAWPKEAQAGGAQGYVTKPIDIHALRTFVEQFG